MNALSVEAEKTLIKLLKETQNGLLTISVSTPEYSKGAIDELNQKYIEIKDLSCEKWTYQVTMLPTAKTYFEDKKKAEIAIMDEKRHEWIKYGISIGISAVALLVSIIALFLR